MKRLTSTHCPLALLGRRKPIIACHADQPSHSSFGSRWLRLLHWKDNGETASLAAGRKIKRALTRSLKVWRAATREVIFLTSTSEVFTPTPIIGRAGQKGASNDPAYYAKVKFVVPSETAGRTAITHCQLHLLVIDFFEKPIPITPEVANSEISGFF